MDIFFYSPCRPVSYRYLLCGDIYRFYRNPTLKEIHSFIGKGEVLIKHYDIWPCLIRTDPISHSEYLVTVHSQNSLNVVKKYLILKFHMIALLHSIIVGGRWILVSCLVVRKQELKWIWFIKNLLRCVLLPIQGSLGPGLCEPVTENPLI